MNDPVTLKPKGFRLAGLAAGLTGIVFSFGVGWSVWQQRDAAWTGAVAKSEAISAALSRQIVMGLQARDVSLQAAARAMGAPGFQAMDADLQEDVLFGSTNPTDAENLTVFDANGTAVGAGDRQDGWSNKDRSLLQRYTTANGLFFSEPYHSPRTQEWSVALSRRASAPDGSFAGTVLQPVRAEVFAGLASGLDLPAGTAVHILMNNGALLYGSGADATDLALSDQLRTSHGLPHVDRIDAAGTQALVTSQQVADLPLTVSVSTTLAAVYRGWLTRTALTLAAWLLVLAACGMVLRLVRRQHSRMVQAERRAAVLSAWGEREPTRTHAGKMEAVGRLTAGVAHDFNNYLQTITSSLEIISADYLAEPEAREIAQLAHKAAHDGAKLTQRLLTFSQQQVLKPSRVDVTFLLNDLRKLVSDARMFEAPIDFRITVERSTSDLLVDPVQLESCLVNVLLNARDAMPQGGVLQLQARNATPAECGSDEGQAQQVILTIRDGGRGMDAATRAAAFDPFFTTKPFGRGAGLGLSTAQGFCHQSGGDIRILDHDGPGTTVEIRLPAARQAMGYESEIQANAATIGRRSARILLVQNDRDSGRAVSNMLADGGFEVVTVTGGAEGLLRLRDRQAFDAVLADQSMQDMASTDFLAQVAMVTLGVPMLVLTNDETDEGWLPGSGRTVRLLRKPVRQLGLLHAVREAIGRDCRAGGARYDTASAAVCRLG